jgi:NTE family protein
VVPQGWCEHPNTWIVACDYATGRRVPFGRDGAPPADLADAVAASCAIPGFYHPIEIAGRRYVDGGMYSTSNLDILRDQALDLVICLNPTSTLHPLQALNPRDAALLLLHRDTGPRLGREAKRLRARGTDVVLIQPVREDLDAMGPNLMSRRNRNEVIATAQRTVAEQLEEAENRELLAALPAGRPENVRRPPGDPSEWPQLADLRGTATHTSAGT